MDEWLDHTLLKAIFSFQFRNIVSPHLAVDFYNLDLKHIEDDVPKELMLKLIAVVLCSCINTRNEVQSKQYFIT